MEFLCYFNTIDKEYVVIHIRKGADYMKLKKILALFLSVAMVAPSVPLLRTNVQAAQMEGTSSETLEKLRIPSDPISVGEEGENPYGNGAFNMYPRYELMLRDNVNHGSSTLTKVYDYDKNKSGQIWDNQNYSTSRNKSYDASVSTAFDWDGDGRKNHIARVTVNFHYEEGAAFDLDIEDDKGNLLDRTSLGLTSKGELPGYELLSSLAVTSGDYDGDGKDEVAVYRPYNIKGVYPFVNVYKFTKSSSGKPSSKNWVDWDIKDLIGGTPDNSATSGFNGAAIVKLESGDLTNDLRDELIVTAGYRKSAGNNTKWMKPKSVILSCEGKETKLSVKAGFDHAWKYSDYNADDKSGKVQVSAYGASALGDVDGDGKVELVLAGYDINEDSLDSGSTDLNQQSANIAVVEYDEAKRRYYLGAGGVGQSIPVHPNVADGMWDANNHQPIAVKCFSPYGTGNKDLIFVGGMVYELKESSTDASYSGVSVPSNHPAKKYGYKCLHQTRCIFPRDDDEVYFGDKDDETDNIWIGTVAAGNFMNNENGGEQLIFEHGRKRDDEGQYRHDLVSVYIDNNSNLASSYTCYNNDQATFYCRNIDLTAIDNDNDSAIMKFKSKAAYFSDPHVIAVLQAAPFFSDLEQLNPDYIEDGETLLGKSSGSGSTDTNGFSISGSIITGYKNEVSFLGITRLGGVDFEVELQASMGGEFEKASEVVYSTEYSSDSLKDRVVLSMTPYIRYVYDLYVPGFKIPTESEYNAKCKELEAKPDGAKELKNYKEEIEKVLEKGFRYGQTVPAYTTDYIVCMPQQIRMSMVEVDVYDEMAEVNDFEKIKGNVLTETVGDPFTYPNSSSGMDCFDGGKDIVGDNANVDNSNFIYVSKGGGTVTQSIETSESSSKAITWGAGISTSLVSDGAGVKIGFAASADYTGSHAWTDYSSTVCSGTVAGIPNESVSLGYDFKWRFGQWKDKLNGEECIVLGYLTKDVTAPPYAPKNLTVKDTTDTTVTLNWNHPTSRGKAYEIFLLTNNAHSPYYKLATVSNSTTEYTVENLSPNSTYSFVMKSINDTNISTYTLPLTVRTQYPDGANVPKTDKLNDIHTIAGATAFLNAKATPADGGGVVSYQWQRIEVSNNVSEWVNIPGENSEKLELREVKESQNETRYRCEVAQMVGGEVVYVYTNTATLYVGKGDSSTSLSIDSSYGTASGSYQIPNEVMTDVQKEMKVDVDNNSYSVLQKSDQTYILLADDNETGAVSRYVVFRDSEAYTELEKAKLDNVKNVTLSGKAGMLPLSVVSEFVMEDGTRTEISDNIAFTDEKGNITVEGSELPYQKKYTDGIKTIYENTQTIIEEDGTTTNTVTSYYYTADSASYPVAVTTRIVGYRDEDSKFYDLTDLSNVSVTEKQTSIEYTQKDVLGTPLTLTATVESLSNGINVVPTGVVEFEINSNGDENPILKAVELSPNSSEVNKNTASITWTAGKECSYTIIARYKGDNALLHSFSNPQYYEAYAIKSKDLQQEINTLVLEGKDKVDVGLPIELVPKIRTTTVMNDGSKATGTEVTDTLLAADEVNYHVELLYGADASKLYTLKGNTFTPLNEGTFVITAEHQIDEMTMSTSKTIYAITISGEQQQIYFESPSMTVFATDVEVVNPLINYNAGTLVSFSSINEEVANVDKNGKVTIQGAGTTTINAVSSIANKQDVSTSYVLTVIKKPITITAGDLEVEYGMTTEEILVKAAETEPEISIAGINLEDISNEEPTYITNYTSGSSVGGYNLNISGLVSDHYDISYVSGNIIVMPKIITVEDIEVTVIDREYDQTSNAKVTATIKEETKYPGDSVTLEVTGSFEDENADQNKTVNYTITGIGGSNNTNYTLQPDIITGTLSASIWPAEVKFSISVTSFVYDGEPHAVEIDANCAGDLFTDFIVKYDNEELAPTQAGSYPITIEMNENYTGAPADLELVISPSDQKELIITGLPRTVEYGGAFMLNTVGGQGDGVVNWSSSDPSIVEIHSDTGEVKILRSGTEVTITATKAASANYNEQSTSITFVPDKKAVTFKLYDLVHSYDGAVKKVSIKAMDSVTYEVAYTDATGKDIAEPVNAGTYYVTVFATGSYEGRAEGILTISKAEIDTNPTLEINNSVYGQPISPAILVGNPDGTQTIIKYVGTGIYTPQSSMPKKVGSYTAIAEIAGENYETLTVIKEFVIEKAVITVTIQPVSRQYGAENPEFELKYSGFEYDEDESVFLEVPKTKCSAKANSPVGIYDITASYGRADNYTFDCTAKGTLTVSPMDKDALFIIGSNRDVFVGEEFVLHAYCGSVMPKVSWSSSDESIATVDENGRVKALLSGTVNITATLNDSNCYQQSAEFILNVIKKNITLMPTNTVCIFNNKEQGVSFISSDSSFVPASDNVRVTYTLTTKSSVTTAKGVGVYSCLYEIADTKYAGVGEFTFYINKAHVIKPKDNTKKKGGNSSSYVTCTVSFDSDGGSEISNINVIKNNTVSIPVVPTKEGYIFDGWFTDKKCKVEYDFDTKVTKNIALYAKWTKKIVEQIVIPSVPGNINEENYIEPTQIPASEEWKNQFMDVAENNWFYNAVKYVVENKLFVGASEKEFAPDEEITRGMLVTVLYHAESEPQSSSSSKFDDVVADAYYVKAVVWAEANGIVKGVSDTKSAPDKLITREEIAVIMKNYADFKGITTNEKHDLTRFADAAQVAGWAKSNMEWALAYGLFLGKGNDRIDSMCNATRAEVAAILQRFFEKIK